VNESQQCSIVKNIVDGVEVLAKKFGYFMVNKEMIGFNEDLMGKVWLN
jgi:hypothetical protein